MDEDGVIVAKFFENSLHFRPSAQQLLRAALGEEIELPPLDAPPGEVAFDVHLDGEVLRPGVKSELVIRFAVPEGQHLYGEPVPEGIVATSVTIDDEVGLNVWDATFPPTHEHTLTTGETLHVYEGDVLVRIPITHMNRSRTELDDGSFVQRISGTVRWQACDDDMCFLPRTETFSIDVPAGVHSRPDDEFADPDGMAIIDHLQRMASRRTDESFADLLRKAAAD